MDCHWDSFRLTSSRPGHTGVPARCTRDEAEPADEPGAAPLSTELWHCTAYPGPAEKCKAGSHLGSTLKPGGAVLTLGVFRRSRSVACIRADASPSEVLAKAIVPPNSERVNLSRVNDHSRSVSVDRDPLWLFMNQDGNRRGRPRRRRRQHRRIRWTASGVKVTVQLLSATRPPADG
jgi:hypothetical protein